MSVGYLSDDNLYTFLQLYLQHGDPRPLPDDPVEKRSEVKKRYERARPFIVKEFGELTLDLVLSTLERAKTLIGFRDGCPVGFRAAYVACGPPEWRCTTCIVGNGDQRGKLLTVSVETPSAPRVVTDTHWAESLCLDDAGVRPAIFFVNSCDACGKAFHYEYISREHSLAERQAAVMADIELPDVSIFRDNVALLPVVRCHLNGRFCVTRDCLVRHHSAQERTQESAQGVVEILESSRARERLTEGPHRTAASIRGGLDLADWCSPTNGHTIYDNAYMQWRLLSQQSKLGIVLMKPGAFFDQETREGEYQRTSTALQVAHRRRYTIEESMCCVLLDECNVVIADGCHKPKPDACIFDDILVQSLPDICEIPYGCQKDRLRQSDCCRYHLDFLGRRSVQPTDLTTDSRIIQDYARADGIAHARRVAATLTAAANTAGDGGGTTSAGASTERALVSSSVSSSDLPAAEEHRRSSSSSKFDHSSAFEMAVKAISEASLNLDRRVSRRTLQAVGFLPPPPDTKREAAAETVTVVDGSSSNKKELAAKVANPTEKKEKSINELVRMAKGTKAKEKTTFDEVYGGFIDEDSFVEQGAAHHVSFGKTVHIVEEIVDIKMVGLEEMAEVKWKGWKGTTMEPVGANLLKAHIDKFKDAVAHGATPPVRIYPRDEAVPHNPNLPRDVLAMSMTQFAETLASSECTALKAMQIGEPPDGYFNTTAGVLAYGTECGKFMDADWMRRSETTTQTLFMLARMKAEADEAGSDWADRLKAMAIDHACKVKLHVRAKRRDLPTDSPSRPFYEWVDNLAMFVDNFHIDCHSKNDLFCVLTTHPDLFPEFATEANSEVMEQKWSWFSRFKQIICSCGLNKATFLMRDYMQLHCERILDSQIMDSEFMPEVRLDELLAAYDFPREAGEKTVRTRRRLADFLATNCSTRWDMTRLEEHRKHAGGHWRDLVKGARKRKVEGERGASNVPSSSRHHARDGRKARRMPLPFQNAKKYVADEDDDDAD